MCTLSRLLELLAESKALQNLGISIPDSARNLLKQVYACTVLHVCACASAKWRQILSENIVDLARLQQFYHLQKGYKLAMHKLNSVTPISQLSACYSITHTFTMCTLCVNFFLSFSPGISHQELQTTARTCTGRLLLCAKLNRPSTAATHGFSHWLCRP